MNAERMFHVAGVALLVFYVLLCVFANYINASVFLPVAFVACIVGNALLLRAGLLRDDRKRQAFLDELRGERERQAEGSNLEESQ